MQLKIKFKLSRGCTMHPCNRQDESFVMISINFSNYDYLFSHDNNYFENFVTATVPFYKVIISYKKCHDIQYAIN